MKKISMAHIVPQVKECFRLFPMEAVLGLMFFVVYCCRYESNSNTARDLSTVLAFFPLSLVAVYACHYICRWLYWLCPIVIAVALALFYSDLGNFVDSPAYAYSLLLAAFIFVAHRRAADNRAFSNQTVRLLINALLSGFTGGVLWVAILLILISMAYIFEFSSDWTSYHAGGVVLFFVIPLLFCYMQHRDEQSRNHYSLQSKFTQVILNYILNPAIVIYTVILFVYFIKIAVEWELPKGNVAYMVLAFIIASFAGQMSQLVVKKPLFGWFYRYFTWIALPPLALFWVGLAYRFAAYGFTESRIYLLAAGVLMTAFVVFLLFRKLNSFRLMLSISSIAIVLLTYIPGISAKSMGVAAQEARVRSLAKELGLLNAEGRLQATEHFTPKNATEQEMVNQLVSAYNYVAADITPEVTAAKLGTNKLKDKSLTETGSMPIHTFYIPDGLAVNPVGYSRVYIAVSLKNGELNIKGMPTVKVNPDYFHRYRSYYRRWAQGGAVDSVEPFIYRMDSCMVVFPYLSYREGSESCLLTQDGLTVFVK